MSAEIVPFLFESTQIRVIVGEDGAPWFVAADVCAALGVANSRDAIARLDADEKGVASADTPGGHQQMATISEPGVYRLVFTSRVDGAERFKRWLAHEVLPAIRKTGRYAAPGVISNETPLLPATDPVTRHLSLAKVLPTVVVGLKQEMAVAVALDAIHRDTGLTTEPYRKLLPAASEPPARLNATDLGRELGLSARRTNLALEAKGLLLQGGKGKWLLTKAGEEYAEAVPYTRNGHSGYQLLWKPEVLSLLR